MLMLVVLVCNIVLFFSSFVYINEFSCALNFAAPFDILQVKPMYYVMCTLNVLIAIAVIICIFLYKKRTLQFRIINIVALLFLAFIALMRADLFIEDITDKDLVSSGIITPFIPLIASLSSFYAGKFIKKDEELVRSADRIR